MRRFRPLVIALAALLVIAAVAAGGAVMRAKTVGERHDSLRTALEVMSLVHVNYVDEVSLSTMISGYVRKGTIPGMLGLSLKDPYSRYLAPAAYNELRIDNSGEFGGIGIYLGMSKDNELLVIAPIEGTPAEQAGVKAGDHIVSIDSRTTVNMSSDVAASLMRGPKGTKVTIGVTRGKDNKEKHSFTLTRDVIKVTSVRSEMLGDHLGYVRIASFTGTTADDLEKALKKLEGQGMKGLVLDLRFNPGGLLNAAIDVMNKFVDEGPVVHVVGRTTPKQSFYARPGLAHPHYPIVVLINGGSASAAEIVSGGLQDTKRATLIGVKSFGKGSVQTIYPLSDGSALSLTTQKWLTAGGNSIQLRGITPDIVIKNPGDDEMEAELAKIKAEQKARIANGGEEPQAPKKNDKSSGVGEAKDAKPAVKEAAPAGDKPQGEVKDLQLDKAKEVLKQLVGQLRGAA